MTFQNMWRPVPAAKQSTIDPYQELANAIILQAVHDYRDTMDQKTLSEIENFFLSDWFEILTNIDGRDLLMKLRREKHYDR